MRVSGFTFLKNGTVLGFPYEQSLRSLLPLVDELVVAVGPSSDDTLERVRRLAAAEPRLRVIETTWNEGMASRGFVYSQQKMIAQFNCTGDWAFYLEGDEVIHEQDVPAIRAALERHLGDPRVEALAFDYLHFYGRPDQLAISPAWYRRECRVIRNTIRSYAPDGQYWVVMDLRRTGRYPRAALAGVPIYHYGHVRKRERMAAKVRATVKYWDVAPAETFDYGNFDPQALGPFTGTHPAIMREWLATEAELEFAPVPGYRLSLREKKHRWLMRLERLLGADFSKRHFTLVR